jgi:intein-encoded DNA endonuclease-like protein
MKWTDKEIAFLIENYTNLGPTKIGNDLGRPMKLVSKKALQLGLARGIAAGNASRRNAWAFTGWSYDLGYTTGVYLGDGNVWQSGRGDYFRLSVVDNDFALATKNKLESATGYEAYLSSTPKANERCQDQVTVTLSNTDFAAWLVQEFGPAKRKQMKVLPTLEACRGLVEGFADSEGSFNNQTISIRAYMDLKPLATMLHMLGVNRLNNNGKPIGKPRITVNQNTYSANLDHYLNGINISPKEWLAGGLGTYIKRKAIGIPYLGGS